MINSKQQKKAVLVIFYLKKKTKKFISQKVNKTYIFVKLSISF